MPSCAAFKCRNRSGKAAKIKKSFHTFPKSPPELRKEWATRIGRGPAWEPSSKSVLCCDHFHEKCFDRTGQTTRLRHRALPTIFSFHISKDGKIEKLPSSSALSYLLKAAEMAKLPADHMFMALEDTDTCTSATATGSTATGSTATGSTSTGSTTTGSTAIGITATPTSASQSKNTKKEEFTHDHTYSVINCPKDVKHKLDMIHNRMDVMNKKLRSTQTNHNRLCVREKSLTQEIQRLRAKQEHALLRIEEISDSLHFGL